jgi:HK97 family phage prohead protease
MSKQIFYKTQITSFLTEDLEDDGTFSGYASVFDCVDLHNDQVMPGAFQNSLAKWQFKNELPKMLWQHDGRQPVGKWVDIYEDAIGLFVKGKLLIDTSAGLDAYKLLKHRVVDGLSIGFSMEKATPAKTGHQLIHEVDLHEISLVTFAANPKAKVSWIKNHNPENFYCRINNLCAKIEKATLH